MTRMKAPQAGNSDAMASTSAQPRKRWPLGRYGLSIVLAGMFLASWIGQFISQLIEVGNDAREHGQSFSMSEFWPQFWSATFENWQSEFLQLLTFVVLLLAMKHVLFKADAEDMEQVQMDLAEIKEHLGISPRDELTANELRDAHRTRGQM